MMQHYRLNMLPFPGFSCRVGQTVKSVFATPVGKSGWFAVAAAVAVLTVVILLIAHTWAAIGDTAISTAGWVAIAFGVLVTTVLGIGLMALVFISNREGFDEAGGITRVGAQSAPPSFSDTSAGRQQDRGALTAPLRSTRPMALHESSDQ